jgi:hypothetical protein
MRRRHRAVLDPGGTGASDDLLERLNAGVAHVQDLLIDPHDQARVRVPDHVQRSSQWEIEPRHLARMTAASTILRRTLWHVGRVA